MWPVDASKCIEQLKIFRPDTILENQHENGPLLLILPPPPQIESHTPMEVNEGLSKMEKKDSKKNDLE